MAICQQRTQSRSVHWLILVGGCTLTGCSNAPPRVEAPSWDPDAIADRVFAELDANGDLTIQQDEAQGAPGLAAGFQRLDRDRNKQVSRDELVQRLQLYRKLQTGLTAKTYEVLLNGRPLRAAKIEFIPEDFQGGVTGVASGVTDEFGMVQPHTEGQDLPAMQIGYYRVKVYDPRSQNAGEVELKGPVGVEVSPISEADEQGTPQLKLRT